MRPPYNLGIPGIDPRVLFSFIFPNVSSVNTSVIVAESTLRAKHCHSLKWCVHSAIHPGDK